MIARCEPECFHRAIYYIKNLSHKQGHNRKENVIVSTEKIRKTGGNNLPLIAQGHTVFSRQRVDVFHQGEVVSTQSARQNKDATDLVMEVAGLDCRNGNENGNICGTLQQGTSGSSLNSIHPVRTGQLIRRLTPMECERLQGFPDGWTDLPGASDSARYKALGNSVAIPCVDFVLRGIAYFLKK